SQVGLEDRGIGRGRINNCAAELDNGLFSRQSAQFFWQTRRFWIKTHTEQRVILAFSRQQFFQERHLVSLLLAWHLARTGLDHRATFAAERAIVRRVRTRGNREERVEGS